MKAKVFILLLVVAGLLAPRALIHADVVDTDGDGLSDTDEVLYHTDPHNPDTDHDTFPDGAEVQNDYDPNVDSGVKLQRHIEVSLKNQNLTYMLGPYEIKTIKISSGIRTKPTPKGSFPILEKVPLVNYKGPGYNYPHTKWNLKFKNSAIGGYYIHGAYWHHNFGHPMSHGCINVSYKDMEPLYNWAKVGTVININ